MITSLIDDFKKKWGYIFLASMLVSILVFTIMKKDYSYNEKKEVKPEVRSDTKIFVDISGAVVRPDLYELPLDARLKEALKIAGGVSSNVDIAWVAKNLNLAKRLKDADKVYIPFEWEVYESSMTKDEELLNPFISDNSNVVGAKSSLINVNKASKLELESLPGIGPTYADRIIQYRPYKDIGELARIAKIPSSAVSKITEMIAF